MNAVVTPKPDWPWLREKTPSASLLWFDQNLQDVKRHAAGRLAYMATPYIEFEAGREQAAAVAEQWERVLVALGLQIAAPAVRSWRYEQARIDHAASLNPLQPEKAPALPNWWAMLQACQLMIVPPVPGWDQSVDVWNAAGKAVRCNMPIMLIGGEG